MNKVGSGKGIWFTKCLIKWNEPSPSGLFYSRDDVAKALARKRPTVGWACKEDAMSIADIAWEVVNFEMTTDGLEICGLILDTPAGKRMGELVQALGKGEWGIGWTALREETGGFVFEALFMDMR